MSVPEDFRYKVLGNSEKASKDGHHLSPDRYGESEILLKGSRENLKVFDPNEI